MKLHSIIYGILMAISVLTLRVESNAQSQGKTHFRNRGFNSSAFNTNTFLASSSELVYVEPKAEPAADCGVKVSAWYKSVCEGYDPTNIYLGSEYNLVGIGTDRPMVKLDVIGRIRSSDLRGYGGFAIVYADGNGVFQAVGGPTSNADKYILQGNGVWALSPWLNSGSNCYNGSLSGSVGIGTSSPSSKLHVSGGDVRIENLSGSSTRSLRVNSQGVIVAGGAVAWELLGNSGTVSPTNFLGTNDAQDLAFKTNSVVNPTPNMIIKYNSGNVGIGTTDPKEYLQVGGRFTFRDDPVNSIIGHNFYYGNSPSRRITNGTASTILMGDNGDIVLSVAPSGSAGSTITDMKLGIRIDNDARVGINTSDPKENLQIGGRFTFRDDPMNSIIGHNFYYGNSPSRRITDGPSSTIMLGDWGDINFSVAPTGLAGSTITNMKLALRIDNNGKVLVGDCHPPVGEVYNLYVLGGVRTEKVQVDLAAGVWADYVFHPDYKLTSLEDLSLFIKENKHLPHIQTESQVCEEGIDVADMTSKLLAKVEELTLYIIQLNEKNIELNKKYEELISKK